VRALPVLRALVSGARHPTLLASWGRRPGQNSSAVPHQHRRACRPGAGPYNLVGTCNGVQLSIATVTWHTSVTLVCY